MFFSLYISSRSINLTNKLIDNIENKQLVFHSLAQDISNNVQAHQSNILQAIILHDVNSKENIEFIFAHLEEKVLKVEQFVETHNFNNQVIDENVKNLKRRLVGYKSVETSLLDAMMSLNEEDINDALIGFNLISIKFSDDINNIIEASKENLSKNIADLKIENNHSKQYIIYSFLIAVLLIGFSTYKLTTLHNQIKIQLKRAESAEQEQKKLQTQLLKYNDDLEQEIERKTKELHNKIYTHFLSGLPNRNKLLEDNVMYNFKQMALLNIDKFQKFNDVYGEEVGNIALVLSAEFLASQIDSENMLLYHLGGDEFVYAVKYSKTKDNTSFIEKIEQILKNFGRENFIYENKNFHFNMSAGIAFNGKNKMLAYADMALKDAKEKNIQLSIFNDDKTLEKIHVGDIECHKKLITAIQADKIISFYQPITPLQDSAKAVKYESLVRIEEANENILPPVNFINVAKANRIYYKITRSVIKNTFNTIAQYKVPISLNLSLKDIENERTMQKLFSELSTFSYNHLVNIELLETEEIIDYKIVYDFCIKVRSYGVKIALDDFGSGYSNFSHILSLPVDYIKIDATLISNIDRDLHSQIMVETIVGLAKKLHVETIAEFVASKEIYDIVKKLNVDYAQGYYVGKPERIEHYLKDTLT